MMASADPSNSRELERERREEEKKKRPEVTFLFFSYHDIALTKPQLINITKP